MESGKYYPLAVVEAKGILNPRMTGSLVAFKNKVTTLGGWIDTAANHGDGTAVGQAQKWGKLHWSTYAPHLGRVAPTCPNHSEAREKHHA